MNIATATQPAKSAPTAVNWSRVLWFLSLAFGLAWPVDLAIDLAVAGHSRHPTALAIPDVVARLFRLAVGDLFL